MSGTAIILGGGVANSVGGALARWFAAGGYHVIVTSRTEDKIHALAEDIRTTGRSAEDMRTDVTSEADQDALFEDADQKDLAAAVINNAGTTRLSR